MGVQAQLPENSVDVFFFFKSSTYFAVLQRGSNGLSMVYFREDYNYPRFQRGSNIFQGVVGQLLPEGGGVQLLISIETDITCEFPRGGGPDPLSPLWIRAYISTKCQVDL